MKTALNLLVDLMTCCAATTVVLTEDRCDNIFPLKEILKNDLNFLVALMTNCVATKVVLTPYIKIKRANSLTNVLNVF